MSSNERYIKSERDYDSRKESGSGRNHRYRRDHRDHRDHRNRRDDNDYKDKHRHNRDSVDSDPIRQRHHPRSRNRSASPSGSEEGSPERPNYLRSGLLALETNRVSVMEAQGIASQKDSSDKKRILSAKDAVVLKYHEPQDRAQKAPVEPRYFLIHIPDSEPESRRYGRDSRKKRDDGSQTIRLDQLTYYLIGTDDRICHIPLDSVDKPQSSEKSGTQKRRPEADPQHAVIQYRVKSKRDKYGETHRKTLPYLIDLESARGTYLNGDKIPAASYVELRHKDLIEFGRVPDQYIFIRDDE